MERIKSYLIHLLGGVTKQELAREKASTYLFWHFCMLNRINSIKQKADSLWHTSRRVVSQGVQVYNRRNRQYGK